jgi:hypothetical protein
LSRLPEDLRTFTSNSNQFVSTTGGSEDLHLKQSADCIDVGDDLSGTFTGDIDGDTRPTGVNTWDIGADELTATAIYYSVGTDNAALYSGNASASSGTLTLASGADDKIGVGDEIREGSNRYYISGRNSSTEFTIQDSAANGGTPGATDITFGSTAIEIYRAFNTLSAAQAGSSDASHLATSDLTSGFQLNWACYNDSAMNDGIIAINGWTTGTGNYIRIYTPTEASEVGVSQRHTGTAGTGFRLAPTLDLSATQDFWYIHVYEEYVRIEGIEVDGSGLTNGRRLSVVRIDDTVSSPNDFRFDKMIIHHFINSDGVNEDSDIYGFQLKTGNVKISNTIIYRLEQLNTNDSSSVNAIHHPDSSSTSYFYNNTIYNIKNSSGNAASANGIKVVAGTVTATSNSIFDTNSTGGSEDCFNGTMTQSNNVSSDTTGTITNKTDYTSYFIHTTDGSENLHIKDDSFNLWGSYGADLNQDPNLPITDDIDGGARDASTPDIGADEYASSGRMNMLPAAVL